MRLLLFVGSQQQSVLGHNCKGTNIYRNIGHHFACCHDSVYTTLDFCERDLYNHRKHFIKYNMFMHCTAMQCKCYRHNIVNQP